MRLLSILTWLLVLLQQNLIAQGWQWQNPLPQGDDLKSVVFVDRSHGWIASSGPTLLRTVDGGQNWELLRPGIIFNDLHFINSDEGWGIGAPRIDISRWGIYHTINRGATWEIQLADTSTRYDIFFHDAMHGWATSNRVGLDELLYTNDGGKNWCPRAQGMFRFNDEIFGLAFLDSLRGWAVGGTFWGIRTIDGGKTWARDSSLAGMDKLFFADTQHGWGINLTNRDIVRTVDGGENWERIRVTDAATEVRLNHFFALDTIRCFVSSNIGLYASTDGGKNWTEYSPQALTSFVLLDPLEACGVIGNQILHSSDGAKTWRNFTRDIFSNGVTFLEAVDFVNAQTGWVAGLHVTTEPPLVRSGVILKTENGGKAWTEQWRKPDVSIGQIIFVDDQQGWGAGSSGHIIHTNNGGQTWQEQQSNTSFILRAITFVDSLHGWSVGGDFVNNSAAGVILHTFDGGKTWLKQTPLFSLPRLFDVTFVDTRHGWVVGGGGSGFDSGIILHTKDGGQTWLIQRAGFGLDLIAATFIDSLNGWIGGYDPQTSAVVIHTNDGGQTWLPQLMDSFHPSDIKFINNLQGWTVSLFGRIYGTTNGGETWQAQQSNTSRYLEAIDFINPQIGFAVGGFGTILYTNDGGVTRVEQALPPPIPKRFILYGNYPNPFNRQTKIRFEIFDSGLKVSLKIYNLQAQIIATLVDDQLAAGLYEIAWHGSSDHVADAPSGLFFYQLEVDGNVQVGKAILLK